MKKMFIVLSVFLVTGATVYAKPGPDPEPDQKVLEGFKKEFPSVREVNWSEQSEFAKASFVMAGRRVIAYFTQQGALEGYIRDIFYEQLPLTVMTAIDKKFPKAEVLDVREINNAEGTSYKIRLVSNKKTVSVKVSADGNIGDIEKLK